MEEKQHAGMRRGVFQSSMVQQMVEGKPPTWWWSTNGDMRPPPQPSSSSSSSYRSSSSSSACPQFSRPSNTPTTSWQDGQGIPESWCQLLFGGFVREEEKHGSMMPLQTMNCEQQVYPSAPAQIADTQQELFGRGYVHMSHGNEEIHASKSTWSQFVPASSPSSCITTSFSTNVLTFSSKADQLPDTSSECNSIETAPAFKKARLEGSSSPKSNPKVRKEKLGERITALHQIVSPFGKTDTASVLLEAIGYIRFLHSQIEVLSSSYLPAASGDLSQPILTENGMKNSGEQDQECNDEQEKELRSRGLCLVPVAFMMHVGSRNGADLWAPALGGGFR